MITPITPQEAKVQWSTTIPDVVFESVNELLIEKYDPHSIKLLQDDIMARILSKTDAYKRQEIYDRHWLDFEDAYRKFGWDVEYDKPAYCETYSPNFTFRKKKE